MLPWLLEMFPNRFPEMSRFLAYISVRSGLALTLAFALSLMAGPAVIAWLHRLKFGQQVRKITKEGAPDLFAMHGAKTGTPTMGGILLAGSLLISVVLLAHWDNPMVWVSIITIFGFGTIGFLDDYLKVVKRNHHGLSAKLKLVGQIVMGVGIGLFMLTAKTKIYYSTTDTLGATFLVVPFFKNIYPNIGILFVPFAVLVVTATSNAVNLTDGLDGLATGCVLICTLALTIVTYLVGRQTYADYLLVPHVSGAGELTVVLCALIGACLGFLWFNAHPAEVFMGDTGSLTIGGLLGTIAILIRQEILLVIIGGIFVVEALSVIIQVASYKTRGKRVFLMSPIHHHFERSGWPETRIVARFWIIAALLALAGLSTLKLR